MVQKSKKRKRVEEERHPVAETLEGDDLAPVHWATVEEWQDLIDRTARHYVHMSGDEFLRRWKAGEFPNPDGTPVMNVVMLLSIDDQKAGGSRKPAPPHAAAGSLMRY